MTRLALLGAAISLSLNITGSGSPTAFVPVHTYFMSPTGNDANTGLDAAHPWASPNHPVVCGDVIIAAAGNYGQFSNFGPVSACPSTTGGINGAGGIYFATLLCGGASVGDCGVVFTATGGFGPQPAMDIGANNWAIEGWKLSGGYSASASGMGINILTNPHPVHHIAMINNISFNNASAFTTDSQGANNGFGFGDDYWAIVGNIAQNSAGRCDGFFDAAIDVIGVKDFDTLPGTHIFVADNKAYNSMQPTGGAAGCASDGENFMFDTIDGLGYSQQIVFRNNIGVKSQRFNLQVFYQDFTNTTPVFKIYNNTLFDCCVGTAPGAALGEFNFQNGDGSTNFPWRVTVTNNIGKTTVASPGGAGGGDVYAMMQGLNGGASNLRVGGSGTQNVFKGLDSGACTSSCDPGNNVVTYGPSALLGTNTYVDPTFSNPADLLNNRMGVPNCSGFTNTTACLGYNASTQTLTSPTFIADLQPNCPGLPNVGNTQWCGGKGYQPPSVTCVASDPDFPTWLKGIVYLHWNGTSVEQRHDLATTPCRL